MAYNKSLETTQMPPARETSCMNPWDTSLYTIKYAELWIKGMRKDSMHLYEKIFKLHCFNEENAVENNVSYASFYVRKEGWDHLFNFI